MGGELWKKAAARLRIGNKSTLIIILIIGVIFMIAAGSGTKTATKSENTAPEISEEERLSDILGKIAGAGRVEVMISYYTSGEKSLAYEEKSSTAENDASSDKKAVLSDGEPVVVKEIYPRVRGVIVTADGADDEKIAGTIKEAVSTALDVPSYRVRVYARQK